MIAAKFVSTCIVCLFFKLFLLTVKCKDYENRTYAGSEINIRSVPYTVYLAPFGCTGALMHPQWVISAGHCIIDEDVTQLYVALGATDSRIALYYIKAHSVYVHPRYLQSYSDPEISISAKYDIALIKLTRPATLSRAVQLLSMDTSEWPNIPVRKCSLVGYGNNIYGNTRLHFSKLLVQMDCGCISNKSVLCANAEEPGDSPCYGDSGSVLVCDNKGVAVTSQATPHSYCYDKTNAMEALQGNVCGQADFYYLFSKLQPNFFWFERVLRDNSDSIINRASKLKTVQYYHLSSSLLTLLYFCR